MDCRNAIFGAAILLLVSLLGTRAAAAQEPKQGPLPPPPKREVTRIPVETTPEAPPIPVEEIIRRLAQKEEEFARARAGYTYRKTIRVQEFGEDNKPSGEFQVTTEPAVASDGKRYEKIVQQPPSTLRRLPLAPEDLEIQLERKIAYFEGLVWVDDRDLVVAKTYGKWVTEVGDVSTPQLPFTLFETQRENIDGKFWFPNYARSDDTLNLKSGEVRIRLTIRWTDYKPVAAASSK